MAKETTVSNIGKELYYDKAGHERAVDALRSVVPIVNNLADHYETFQVGAFTQEVYNDILQGRSNNIALQVQQKVAEKIKSLGLPDKINANIRSEASRDFRKFEESIDKMQQFFNRRTWSADPKWTVHLVYLTDIKIVNERAVVDNELREELRERFVKRITNKNQEEAYQLFLNLQKEYDKLADFLAAVDHEVSPLCYDNDGAALLMVDEDNRLQFRKDCINWIQ